MMRADALPPSAAPMSRPGHGRRTALVATGVAVLAHGALVALLWQRKASEALIAPVSTEISVSLVAERPIQAPATPPARPTAKAALPPTQSSPPQAPAPTPSKAPVVTSRTNQLARPAPAEAAPQPSAPTPAPAAPSPVPTPIPTPAPASSSAHPPAGASSLVPPRFDATYLANPAPVYPPLSRRMGEQGKVLLRVQVDAEGTPQEVALYRSCGVARLDEAALAAVRRWQFQPARQAGQAVAASVIVPIDFKLKTMSDEAP